MGESRIERAVDYITKLFHTENNANARSLLQEEGLSEGGIEEMN